MEVLRQAQTRMAVAISKVTTNSVPLVLRSYRTRYHLSPKTLIKAKVESEESKKVFCNNLKRATNICWENQTGQIKTNKAISIHLFRTNLRTETTVNRYNFIQAKQQIKQAARLRANIAAMQEQELAIHQKDKLRTENDYNYQICNHMNKKIRISWMEMLVQSRVGRERIVNIRSGHRQQYLFLKNQ